VLTKVKVNCEAGLNVFSVRSETVAFHAVYAFFSNSAFEFPDAPVCPGNVAERNPQQAPTCQAHDTPVKGN